MYRVTINSRKSLSRKLISFASISTFFCAQHSNHLTEQNDKRPLSTEKLASKFIHLMRERGEEERQREKLILKSATAEMFWFALPTAQRVVRIKQINATASHIRTAHQHKLGSRFHQNNIDDVAKKKEKASQGRREALKKKTERVSALGFVRR